MMSRPVLRSLGNGESVPLAFAKTLVGRDPLKCDVVLTGSSVLELHALISLAENQSSATIVPFAKEAMCRCNQQAIPLEGATIVHGDHVSFGTHAYVFELVASSNSPQKENQMHAGNQPSQLNRQSLRATMDSLRGDRNLPSKPSFSTTKSTKLSQFLMNASSDSVLREYVERKLRQSNEQTATRRQRPIAMEPPPSLSASTVSSVQLNDSMHSTKSLSLAARNVAEVEKLRLSQRLREVNNVLNGFLDFNESFMATPGEENQWKPPHEDEENQDHEEDDEDLAEEEDEEEEEEEDELPAMSEKPPVRRQTRVLVAPEPVAPPRLVDSLPAVSALATVEPVHPMAQGPVEPPAVVPPANGSKRTKRSSLHQQLINKTIRHKRLDALSHALVRWKRGLRIQHQQRLLKAQQLVQVRNKLARLRHRHGFQRWKAMAKHRTALLETRLMHFQQRSVFRQLVGVWHQLLHLHLVRQHQRTAWSHLGTLVDHKPLRRAFTKWQRQIHALTHQLTLQSLKQTHEAQWNKRMDKVAGRHYEQRVVVQQLMRAWAIWKQHTDIHAKRRRQLHKLVRHWICRRQATAWRRWKQHSLLLQQRQVLQQTHQMKLASALQHHQTQWTKERDQLIAQHTTTTQALQQQQQEQAAQLAMERKREQEAQQKQQEAQQQQAVKERKQQVAKERQQHQQAAAQAKAQWLESIEQFLEQVNGQMDQQILTTSEHIEQLLQHAERDVSSARFRAASFLVEATLEQKLTHTNAKVKAQEQVWTLLTQHSLSSTPQPPLKDNDGRNEWTENAKFLYEIAQQRIQRLYQLHQAIVKLAAAVSTTQCDGRKLENGTYLADTMRERDRTFVQQMLLILYRRRHLSAYGA